MRRYSSPVLRVVVKFKPLLDRWKKDPVPVRTAKEYAIRLDLDDAARLHALLNCFPDSPSKSRDRPAAHRS
jgi:hypothetical protein